MKWQLFIHRIIIRNWLTLFSRDFYDYWVRTRNQDNMYKRLQYEGMMKRKELKTKQGVANWQ